MKVLCHPKEGGAEVEATLDPMTNGWSMGLVFEEVFLASGVWVVTETRVGVCSAMGHRILWRVHWKSSVSFYEDRKLGEWFVEEFVMGLINPRQVGRPGTSTQYSYYAFAPYRRLVQGWA